MGNLSLGKRSPNKLDELEQRVTHQRHEGRQTAMTLAS